MNAVIISGGKQYRVTPGQVLKLEKLPHAVGETVAFEKVLLLSDGVSDIKMGAPFIIGASVMGEVVDQGRHKKVHIVKMRRRKHYMRRQGHRQDYTEVKITEING
jgi:large subunit ribosomal protein L21